MASRFHAGIPKCLSSSIVLMLLSLLIVTQINAREHNDFHFPKGIVLNSGQYPSFVHGYMQMGNVTYWFERNGLLIDVHTPKGGHVFRLKSKRIPNDIIPGDIVHARNVIHATSHQIQEHVVRDLSFKDESGALLYAFDIGQSNLLRWTMDKHQVKDMMFDIEGADSLSLDALSGDVYVHAGDIHIPIPSPLLKDSYNQIYASRGILHSAGRISFNGKEEKSEQAMAIPIKFTTFIGGGSAETINAITLDQIGNIYVVGETESPDYPISTGAYISNNPIPKDVFLAKFDSTGKNILYSSRIGGAQVERGTSIAVDNLGQACITGSTTSLDFPSTPNAIQTEKKISDEDVFVIKVNASGTSLLYGTFLIGMTTDIGHAITLDEKGDMFIAGTTGILSKNPHTFPKTPFAYDTSYNGGALDAFIAKISPEGKGFDDLRFCSVLGGNDLDIAYKVVVSKSGDVIIAGETASDKLFPTTSGAIQSTHLGLSDGFVAVFSSKGDSLKYSTLIGGSGYERITGLVFDETSQNILFAGYTNSSGIADANNPSPIKFPVTKAAFDTTYNGGIYDGFIGKLDPVPGASLKFSSLIGGRGDDYITGLGVDVCAAPYITGTTSSNDFPLTDDASDSTIKKSDGFITKLNAFANILVFSSFFGNDDEDQINGIHVDQSGAIYIGGTVNGNQVPGSNVNTNGRDGFLSKMQIGILPLKPYIEKTGNLSFCTGDSVKLDATSRNFVSYQWRKNKVIIPGGNTSILTVKESGVYTVDVADASGCAGSESVTIIAFDRPAPTFEDIPLICAGDTVQLSVVSKDSLQSISWSPTTGLSCSDCLNPKAFPPMTTKYTLKTIDTNGCIRFDTVTVNVIDSLLISAQNIQDTVTLCPGASTVLRFPIKNSSNVDVLMRIVSVSDPLLTSTVDSITVFADSVAYIPFTFKGTMSLGIKKYQVSFSNKCGSLSIAHCIVNVMQPNITYRLDTSTEICKAVITNQTMRFINKNSLSGKISIRSLDSGFSAKPNFVNMKAFGIDSIDIEYRSNNAGLIPIRIIVDHECGSRDTLTWNINVISNPYEMIWKQDTIKHPLNSGIIKSFTIDNQLNLPLNDRTTFDLSLLHEYSALSLDSVSSTDCGIALKRFGDTIRLQLENCIDKQRVSANLHFTPLIGETLQPWLRILEFSSKDPCIKPIVNKANDSLLLETYGCELSTLKVGRSASQLKAVRMNPANSQLMVRYVMTERRPAHFSCINAVGQILHSFTIPVHELGEHEILIPVNGLAIGMYALIFESGEHAESSLFTIME